MYRLRNYDYDKEEVVPVVQTTSIIDRIAELYDISRSNKAEQEREEFKRALVDFVAERDPEEYPTLTSFADAVHRVLLFADPSTSMRSTSVRNRLKKTLEEIKIILQAPREWEQGFLARVTWRDVDQLLKAKESRGAAAPVKFNIDSLGTNCLNPDLGGFHHFVLRGSSLETTTGECKFCPETRIMNNTDTSSSWRKSIRQEPRA